MKKRNAFSSVLPDGCRVRTEAKALLCDGGGRLLLIEAILVAVMPAAVCFLLPTLLHYALLPFLWEHAIVQTLVTLGSNLAVWLCLWFFVFPLFFGVLRIAYLLENSETATLADVFWAFGASRNYRRALSWAFSVLWRVALSWLAIVGTLMLLARGISMLVSGELLMTVLGMLFVLGEVCLAVPFCLARFSGTWACVTETCTTSKTVLPRRLPYRMRAGLRFLFGHMPMILLSILSFGVYFLLDALPRMLLGYFRYCRIWNELTIRSEENRDE